MTTAEHTTRAGAFAGRHPVIAFVALAYGISWTLWAIAFAVGSDVIFLLGGFGPAAAAAIVIHAGGESIKDWLRPIWHLRVAPRWWLYALGLPILLFGLASLVLQLIGEPVDWSLAVDRLPQYLGTFVFVLVLGGALEEPGWRGFGLPRLQERYSPLRATLLIGLAWGVWHLPAYGPAGFVVPMVLAFFYTVLWNRTGSVALCILLHASFTPAQDHLILLPQSAVHSTALDMTDWVIFGTYVFAALVLVALTRGRLGWQGTTGSLVYTNANGRSGHHTKDLHV
ncbi:MAG TPA: type II CAAX endopeptidase family protein [Jiangellaceae bacterium]